MTEASEANEHLLKQQEQQLVDDFFSCASYGFARGYKVIPEAFDAFRERMRTDSQGKFKESLLAVNQAQTEKLLSVYQYSAQSQTQRPDLYPVDESTKPQVFRMEYTPSQELPDRYQPVVMSAWKVGNNKAVSIISEKVLQLEASK